MASRSPILGSDLYCRPANGKDLVFLVAMAFGHHCHCIQSPHLRCLELGTYFTRYYVLIIVGVFNWFFKNSESSQSCAGIFDPCDV